MSMRPDVDRTRIEQFLSRLGQLTNEPARVLLVGGCAVVHAGLRARTLDIDAALEGQGESEVLAGQGYIHLNQLDTFYEEILPQIGTGQYFNVDPADFAANYAAIRQKLVSGATTVNPPTNPGEVPNEH